MVKRGDAIKANKFVFTAFWGIMLKRNKLIVDINKMLNGIYLPHGTNHEGAQKTTRVKLNPLLHHGARSPYI